jgi:hypothetical protein
MYQLNGFEIWREHRNELLEEAEDHRLARQLRKARSKREASSKGRTRRRMVPLLSNLFGGPGNDDVNAVEGARDVIDCGAGRDRVAFDAGVDSVKHCEIKTPL